MAENRRGLGRGLSALLGEVEEAQAPVAPAQAGQASPFGVRETPIELIRRNPEQPRKTFRAEEIDELAASIAEKGVLQPILVRPSPSAPGEFEIVAGERRWRAAQKAGLGVVPAVVREFDDLEVLEIGIVENVQRADLNPVEEAAAYRALMDRFGRTQEAVAQAVGKSRSHVANMLRLLALPEPVQEHLRQERLSAGHARAIAAAPDPESLAEEIVRSGLSVRDAEQLARTAQGKGGAGRPAPSVRIKDADTAALENDLAETLGLKVEIADRNGAGAVTIRYATLEQLDDLCRRLTRS